MSNQISKRVGYIQGLMKAGDFDGHENVHQVFAEMLKLMEMLEKRLNELEKRLDEAETDITRVESKTDGIESGLGLASTLSSLLNGMDDYDDGEDEDDYIEEDDDDDDEDNDILFLHDSSRRKCPVCGIEIQNARARKCPSCGSKL